MQQCGLCSALAQIFRRLLCIAGSRRGSAQSCSQDAQDRRDPRRDGISIDRSEHGLFISMPDPSTALPTRPKRLSQSDRLLLETLDTRHKRPHHTGRFLTLHKRRRKRLATRSLVRDRALLDDIHHGQVHCVLEKVNQWPFNAFILDNVTGGRSLPVLCVHLFHWYGLLDHFKLDVARCWKFFSLIEEGYHSTNPYHNSIHATDVTQAMHCFLQEKKIREHLTPLEIMASLIAAVTHDLDHPGVNQPFLIATSNHLAALYENSSVLENHHWRSAIACLLESHLAEELEECRSELQAQISSLILATDITRQQEFLVRFKRYLDQDVLDMKLKEHRHFILQIALKCADISNPCRPWEVSKKWSLKVCEEFFRQGDYERQLNLPVTAVCDRQNTSVPKIQAGFFTFVVYPLFEEWHRFLGDGLSDDMMKNLHGNKLKWDALIMQENANKGQEEKQEESCAEDKPNEQSLPDSPSHPESVALAPSCSPSPVHSTEVETEPTTGFLLPSSASDSRRKIGRRHSVPLSVPEPPALARTITRRESLPVSENKSHVRFRSCALPEQVDEEEAEKDWTESSLSSPPASASVSASDGLSESVDRGDKRPPSSESLLPEPSITSMTTDAEASRLSTVLNKGKSFLQTPVKCRLKRQQTFPPVQPCFRQRYLSAATDLSEAEKERLKGRTSMSSSEGDESETSKRKSVCSSKKGCGTTTHSPLRMPALKESNRCLGNRSEAETYACTKREIDDSDPERTAKVAKLLGYGFSLKENLDPRRFFLDSAQLHDPTRKNTPQGHVFGRRGSAPVSSDILESAALAPRSRNGRYPRRGSVPLDAVGCNTYRENLRNAPDVSFCFSQQHCLYQKRGSVSAETGCSESNKTKIRNKKTLRRRRSGGPEMFFLSENGGEHTRWKKEILAKATTSSSTSASTFSAGPDSLSFSLSNRRRRGSLPIELLLVKHSGDQREMEDS